MEDVNSSSVEKAQLDRISQHMRDCLAHYVFEPNNETTALGIIDAIKGTLQDKCADYKIEVTPRPDGVCDIDLFITPHPTIEITVTI